MNAVNSITPSVYVEASAGYLNKQYTENYAMTGAAYAAQGDYLCEQGKAGNAGCGQVLSTDGSNQFGLTGLIYIRFDPYSLASCQGDSGGPVFVQGHAYGIVESGDPNYQFTGPDGTLCYTRYLAEPIHRIFNQRRVQLAAT